MWDIADSRATLDIDTLAKTSNSLDNTISIIKELCERIPSVDDGLTFSVCGNWLPAILRHFSGVIDENVLKLVQSKVTKEIHRGIDDALQRDSCRLL